MGLRIYQFTGKANEVDKGESLLQVLFIGCSLKTRTSTLKPSFLISLYEVAYPTLTTSLGDITSKSGDVTSAYDGVLSAIGKCNYCYYEELGRYYFIDDIVMAESYLVELVCHEDVLYTHRNSILGQKAFVLRCSSVYNELLTDNEVPLSPSVEVEEEDVTDDSEGEVDHIDIDPDYWGDNNVVLVTVNDDPVIASNVIVETYPPPEAGIFGPVNGMTCPNSSLNVAYVLSHDQLDVLSASLFNNELYNLSDYETYIKRILIYPFRCPTYILPLTENNPSTVKLTIADSKTSYFDIDCHYIWQQTPYMFTLCRFQMPEAVSFLDLMASYQLYVPLLGWIDLDMKKVGSDTLAVFLIVDYFTGDGRFIVYDTDANYVIKDSTVPVGIPLGLTTSDSAEKERNKLLGSIQGAIQVLSGLALAATGNPFLGLMGVTRSASGALQLTKAVLSNETTSGSSQSAGTACSLFMSKKVRLRKTSYSLLSGDAYDENWVSLFGRPLEAVLELTAGLGFVKCDSSGFECGTSDLSISKPEIDEIRDLLAAGVYL